MITKEVREWLKKVETKQYSYNDAIYELAHISSYLTVEELKMLKQKLKNSF